jgi:hypothetical protein
MHKLYIFIFFVFFSCNDKNNIGIVKSSDEYSLKSIRFVNKFIRNDHEGIDEFLSESTTLKINDTVYTGLKDIFKMLNLNSKVFSKVSIHNIEASTFFYKDGNLLTSQYLDYTYQSSLSYSNYYIRSVLTYKWFNNKIIEVNCIFDATSINNEIANYQNLTQKN